MRRTTARVLIGITASTALLLSATGIANAQPVSSGAALRVGGGPANPFDFGVDLDDVGPEDGAFEFEVPAEDADFTAMSCPETRNPAKYKITWKLKHIPATDEPVSDWLEPGDSITYTTTKSNTFGFDVTVGAEAEAGVVLLKAKTKIDVTVSKSWTSGVNIHRSSLNRTDKGFRAVLGNKGYRVKYTKTKIVAPCNVKKTVGTIIFPKAGDLSFGRYSK